MMRLTYGQTNTSDCWIHQIAAGTLNAQLPSFSFPLGILPLKFGEIGIRQFSPPSDVPGNEMVRLEIALENQFTKCFCSGAAMSLLYLILFVWCPCVDINNGDRVPEMAALVSSRPWALLISTIISLDIILLTCSLTKQFSYACDNCQKPLYIVENARLFCEYYE